MLHYLNFYQFSCCYVILYTLMLNLRVKLYTHLSSTKHSGAWCTIRKSLCYNLFQELLYLVHFNINMYTL